MGERKNIFLLARRGHERDEDQLTELLAFLWQQEAETLPRWLSSLDDTLSSSTPWEVQTQFVIPSSSRRPDILLTNGGEAAVLIEVKIDAAEGLEQLRDYRAYLLDDRIEPCRALIYLTPRPELIPAFPIPTDGTEDVRFFVSRWQSMADLLTADEETFSSDFFRMLAAEGLVTPPPLTAADWQLWGEASLVHRRVQELLEEARPELVSLVPRLKHVRPLSTSASYMYRIYTFEELSFALGFLPGRTIGYEPIMNVVVLNELLAPEARKAEAHAARTRHPNVCDFVNWGEWPTRSCIASERLTARDFTGQVRQAVEFACESIAEFRRIRYLSQAL